MKKLPITLIGMSAAISLLSSIALAAAPAADARKDYETAIKAMHQAEEQLNKASEDQSGHKAKALEHLRQAIGEADAAQANVKNKNP